VREGRLEVGRGSRQEVANSRSRICVCKIHRQICSLERIEGIGVSAKIDLLNLDEAFISIIIFLPYLQSDLFWQLWEKVELS
jgi:hypothetical protein